MTRYLTKSRFKLALECPSKLFFTGKRDIYYDKKLDDDFLAALAEGGFQVGELAKLYYPGGTTVEELDHKVAISKTSELLKNENVIIYEAAFAFENLFVRADIIVKSRNKIQLIEVKAKSINPATENFVNTKGAIKSGWKPYLFDAAFQKYVVKQQYPHFNVTAYLLLSDKRQVATVDRLNQQFLIYKDGDRSRVKVNDEAKQMDLGSQILYKANVDHLVEKIFGEKEDGKSFPQLVQEFSNAYFTDNQIAPSIGGQCARCEFFIRDISIINGLRSGGHDCWKAKGLTDEQLTQPLILDLWDYRKKPEYILAGKYFLTDLQRQDLESEPTSRGGTILSRIDRQEIQIEKARIKDTSHHLFKDSLKSEMAGWTFPLHFIDFETTAVAIPFNAGRRPYEQIAFQFSHHTVDNNGKIEHAGEWISMEVGAFPNFAFIRALKSELENDNGTIFRYAAHENTILNVIYRQLIDSNEPDKTQLCQWIKTITKSSSSSADEWEGERNMVDMRKLVLDYYFNPLTGGSNSLKYLLPAILQSSDFLQEKYSKPIYGNEISSRNFKDHSWIHLQSIGKITNPYQLLPPIHKEVANEILDELLADEELGILDGGAAMIAFARMQFSEMHNDERERIKNALLRYCELDTFAMVMLYEAWREWCK